MVPVVLGFAPTESVVMLTFGRRAPFHARVDLPARRRRGRRGGGVAARARRAGTGCAGWCFVVYADDASPGRPRAPARLRDAFERAGIEVVEALRADGRRWWPAAGRATGMPRAGWPYDVSAHPFAAQAVVDGRVTHASRERPGGHARRRSRAVAAAAALAWLDRRPRRQRPRRRRSGSRGLVRQHVDAGTTPGRRRGGAAAARDDSTRRCATRRGRRSAASDAQRARRALDRRGAARARPARPAPAALLGFAAWQAGHGRPGVVRRRPVRRGRSRLLAGRPGRRGAHPRAAAGGWEPDSLGRGLTRLAACAPRRPGTRTGHGAHAGVEEELLLVDPETRAAGPRRRAGAQGVPRARARARAARRDDELDQRAVPPPAGDPHRPGRPTSPRLAQRWRRDGTAGEAARGRRTWRSWPAAPCRCGGRPVGGHRRRPLPRDGRDVRRGRAHRRDLRDARPRRRRLRRGGGRGHRPDRAMAAGAGGAHRELAVRSTGEDSGYASWRGAECGPAGRAPADRAVRLGRGLPRRRARS